MKILIPALTVLALLLALSGCVHALHPGTEASQEKIKILTPSDADYRIQLVSDDEIPVPEDGRVLVDIPALRGECSAYLFGFIKVHDGAPERKKVIHILRSGEIVSSLSREEIFELAFDSEGYRLLDLQGNRDANKAR